MQGPGSCVRVWGRAVCAVPGAECPSHVPDLEGGALTPPLVPNHWPRRISPSSQCLTGLHPPASLRKANSLGKKRYEGDGSHEVRLAAAASLCCKCRCDRNGGRGLHQGTCSVRHTSWAPSRLRDPRGARPAESRTKVKWRPKRNQISRPLCKRACAPNP